DPRYRGLLGQPLHELYAVGFGKSVKQIGDGHRKDPRMAGTGPDSVRFETRSPKLIGQPYVKCKSAHSRADRRPQVQRNSEKSLQRCYVRHIFSFVADESPWVGVEPVRCCIGDYSVE